MGTRKFLTFCLIVLALTSCNSHKGKTSDKNATASETRQKDTSQDESDSLIISFEMDDIDGNNVSVADVFKEHKITVIDFWASWCGPCRQEMPAMVNLQNKFGRMGLGIIGVSLDEDKDQWQDAVKEMGMTWLQLSDLQGWNNSAAQMYGIRSIPFTIVVDSKGRVLEAGLRGAELELLIERYFSNNM